MKEMMDAMNQPITPMVNLAEKNKEREDAKGKVAPDINVSGTDSDSDTESSSAGSGSSEISYPDIFKDWDLDEAPEFRMVVDRTNWDPLKRTDPEAIKFRSLGPGNRCEISGCNRQAYAFCNEKVPMCFCIKCLQPAWDGCQRKLCENHIEIHYTEEGKFVSYNCKYYFGDTDIHGTPIQKDFQTECSRERVKSKSRNVIILISSILLPVLAYLYLQNQF